MILTKEPVLIGKDTTLSTRLCKSNKLKSIFVVFVILDVAGTQEIRDIRTIRGSIKEKDK